MRGQQHSNFQRKGKEVVLRKNVPRSGGGGGIGDKALPPVRNASSRARYHRQCDCAVLSSKAFMRTGDAVIGELRWNLQKSCVHTGYAVLHIITPPLLLYRQCFETPYNTFLTQIPKYTRCTLRGPKSQRGGRVAVAQVFPLQDAVAPFSLQR